jgi:uncharacterized protein (DUF1330 family)
MSAYIIFTREKLRDASAIEDYTKATKGSSDGFAIKPLVAHGRFEVKEGAAVEGVVMLEFPSFEEAKAWYESPAYQAAAQHRFRGADYRVVIVEGR